MLGNGSRVASGWQLTGLSLPIGESFYLRARGSAIGGQYNGSVSLIESLAQFYLPGTPPLLVLARSAGVDQFRIGFSYSPGIDFSVRASANIGLPLSNWPALGTPTEFAPRLYQFTKDTAANAPLRFYYLRSE